MANGPAPILILIDDDADAVNRLTGALFPANCFFITVTDPRQGVRYARSLGTAVLVADPVDYPRGGTARLLQELLVLEKPVVVLAEDWSPEVADRWMRRGVRDCIPHPTRTRRRLGRLAGVIERFTLDLIEEREPIGARNP